MKNVLVYFEGPSDIAAMKQLFGDLIEQKTSSGVSIKFFPAPEGDKKHALLTKTPIRAVRTLKNDDTAVVAIVPDLYPPNKGLAHQTPGELRDAVRALVAKECERIAPDRREALVQRFEVFCFKHDLEVLLLACPEALKRRLNTGTLRVSWTKSVEDQNHDNPPKRIIEKLFEAHGQRYEGVADAPQILLGCDYRQLAEACPQGFKPFAEFLENL